MAEPAMNDWLMKGTVRFVEMLMVSKFSIVMNRCSHKTSSIFCGFGCPGSQDNTSLLELLVSLKIWCFLECSELPGVGMINVS